MLSEKQTAFRREYRSRIAGWYNGFNDDYSAIPPTLPLTAIPNPATMTVFMLLGGRRRRMA